MLRKQRKLQPWRRFGYVILIIIKSGELLLWFSPRIINGLRSYIKHSKGCFIWYPNTLKLVKKNSAAPHFFNHFSVFRYQMKHSSSCLIYYIKYHAQTQKKCPKGNCIQILPLFLKSHETNLSETTWTLEIHKTQRDMGFWSLCIGFLFILQQISIRTLTNI